MRYAFLGDIHGNTEALSAVLAHLKAENAWFEARLAPHAGTLPTHGPLFVTLLAESHARMLLHLVAPDEQPETWPALEAMARGRWFEMQAAEGLAMSIYEHGPNMPWEFTYDLARHCWDEVRHCMFGQLYVENLGQNVHDFPVMVGNE